MALFDSLNSGWTNFKNWLGADVYQAGQKVDLGNGTYTYANSDGLVPLSQWDPTTGSTITMYATPSYYASQSATTPVEGTVLTGSGTTSTGLSGVVDSLGGWGNIMQGIGSLGNLYMGLQNIGLQKDALSLAKDSYNTNKALSQANLNNSIDAYNTSLADRYRARAYAETGDASAYDNQIEERKLNSVSL